MSNNNTHVGRPCGEGTETRGEEHANVTNIDREVEGMENVVDDTARGHETRVDGATDYTSQRVPRSVIEPIPERL